MNPPAALRSRILAWLVIAVLPLAVLSAEALAWWWNHPLAHKEGAGLLAYTFPADGKESRRISVNYFECPQFQIQSRFAALAAPQRKGDDARCIGLQCGFHAVHL